MIKYLLLLASLLVFGGTILIAHFLFPKKEKIIIERVLVGIIIALFAVRFLCYDDDRNPTL